MFRLKLGSNNKRLEFLRVVVSLEKEMIYERLRLDFLLVGTPFAKYYRKLVAHYLNEHLTRDK